MLFLDSKNWSAYNSNRCTGGTYNDLKLVLGMSTIFDISVRDVYDVKKNCARKWRIFFIELVITTKFCAPFLLKYIKKMFGKSLQIIKS